MKKDTFQVLICIVLGMIVMFVNFAINVNVDKLSDIRLENVEAEASGEGGGITLYPNHITFLSDEKCAITITNEDGSETKINGIYSYCHEMPNSDCLIGCAI